MKILRWATLFVIISLLVSVAPGKSSAQAPFKDVKTSDEYYQEVNFIAGLGIIDGYTVPGGKEFKPQANINRFQAAKMLVEATKNTNIHTGQVQFKDLQPGNEYYHYLSKAVTLGYFQKKSDGSIKPFEKITRAELAQALSKAFGLTEKITQDKPAMLRDMAEQDAYLNGLYYAGITRGSNGEFGKTKLLTRGQFALFVARAMDRKYALTPQTANQTILATGKVNAGDGLNIRPNPAASGNPIGKLSKGALVSIVKDHGEWVEIRYWKRPAFVSKQYIDFLDSERNPIGSATHFVKVQTNGDTLNVRTLPSTNGIIISKLKDGEVVEVFGTKNNWNLVLVNGLPGYIHSDYTVPHEKEEVPPPAQITGDLIGRVTVASLNVRSQPNDTSAIIGKLTINTKVEVIALKDYWATIKFNGKTGYVHKSYLKLTNKSKLPLKDRIIVLDPGHGAHDPGASSNGKAEKNIALTVSNLVAGKLKNAGAQVLVTRSTDTYLTLQQRTDFAKKHYAETFVSIHVNSAENKSAKGTEVWIDTSKNPNGAESKVLATYLQKNLVKEATMVDRGVKDTNFYVVRNNNVAAALVELGFISNPDDFKKLSSNAFLEKYAEAIYQGLVQYYSID